MMKKLFKLLPHGYGKEYRQTFRLAAPIVLSQMGQMTVQFADNIMVGHLGPDALAGVSFAGSVYFLFFAFGMGLSFGLTPLVGQAFAQGRHRDSVAYLQNALVLNLVVGLALAALMLACIPSFPLMGQEAAVADVAARFFPYIAWSMLPFAIFASVKQFLEGIGITNVEMWIVLVGNVVNVGLCYVLINGKWIFPEMGVEGAGLATLIARSGMAVAVVIYVATRKRFRHYFRLLRTAHYTWRRQLDLIRVGSPIALQTTMEVSAFALTTIMMGWFRLDVDGVSGSVAQAAHSVAMTMCSCTFLAVVAISTATTIRVSHEFGRGNLRQLKRAANAAYHLGTVWNIFAAMLFLIFRHKIGFIFMDDQTVVSLAAVLLVYAAIFQVSDGMQNISIGILRGMQDVRSTMVVAFISYIVINIPVGYLCAFKLGMGPGGLWLGFIVGLTTAAVLLRTRFTRIYRRLRLAER
ncbi:MAG: MATE family efflux transporter [Rikenellaceae bacterium]|jgi:MATE family multidrug resistance protein|nr:MATE family efflux transporter [Rikenellaceae bacterium]